MAKEECDHTFTPFPNVSKCWEISSQAKQFSPQFTSIRTTIRTQFLNRLYPNTWHSLCMTFAWFVTNYFWINKSRQAEKFPVSRSMEIPVFWFEEAPVLKSPSAGQLSDHCCSHSSSFWHFTTIELAGYPVVNSETWSGTEWIRIVMTCHWIYYCLIVLVSLSSLWLPLIWAWYLSAFQQFFFRQDFFFIIQGVKQRHFQRILGRFLIWWHRYIPQSLTGIHPVVWIPDEDRWSLWRIFAVILTIRLVIKKKKKPQWEGVSNSLSSWDTEEMTCESAWTVTVYFTWCATVCCIQPPNVMKFNWSQIVSGIWRIHNLFNYFSARGANTIRSHHDCHWRQRCPREIPGRREYSREASCPYQQLLVLQNRSYVGKAGTCQMDSGIE